MQNVRPTAAEKETLNLLAKAHNSFVSEPAQHPDEVKEWVLAMHRLQDIVAHRILKRTNPQIFK